MSRNGQGRACATRSVLYKVESEANNLNNDAIERVLAAAQRDGIVTGYDAGRGGMAWWEGPPGERMRAVTAAVRAVPRVGATRRSE